MFKINLKIGEVKEWKGLTIARKEDGEYLISYGEASVNGMKCEAELLLNKHLTNLPS